MAQIESIPSLLNYIYFSIQSVRMVKTRKQTQKQELVIIPAKKERRVRKNISIKKDELRQKLKEKMLKQRKQSRSPKIKEIDLNNKELLSIITSQKFNCPICLEIMILPVLTHCGHAFCLPCIEESLKHKNICSLCRQPNNYETIKQSGMLQELIDKVCEKEMNEQELDSYQNRIKQFKEKDKQRKDADLEIGEMVDLYANKRWIEGVVVEIDETGEEPVVKIESTQRQAKTYEFKLSSRLFAKHRYFTRQNTLFRELMGQFRLEINGGFGDIPIFQNLINVQINPVRSELLEDGSEELIRFTFTIQP